MLALSAMIRSFWRARKARSTSAIRALRLCGARRLRAFRLGEPYCQQPGKPQEQKIEREKNDETDMAAKLAFHHRSDPVGGKITCDHECDVIEDELHGGLPCDGPVPGGRLPRGAESSALEIFMPDITGRSSYLFPYTSPPPSSIT